MLSCSTMARALASCRAKMSAVHRHSDRPRRVPETPSLSWAVIPTRCPEVRMLPSRMARAPSLWHTSRTLGVLPL